MKKTYEKPVLVRKGKLSAVVAGPSIIVLPPT
ncbi:putative RiPP precursor [Mesorhizobium sp. WSM4935]|nr:putative RiPP precursor [Mesorhizobium sp. WSM4935]MDG4877672.1 putative RiPP precursor [Mesorhizobium sp. WSM4935]